ncbi:pseudouridylate synthase RPUSD4, mitochondrial-like [Linepithema humile]|uniref:pseudouridylate synthase RPUSD4, mitochondrial-like n=1 Tax=Linepithema humile TaxID=83485 RepID=UPI00351DAF4C
MKSAMIICRTARIGEFAAAYRVCYKRYYTTQENQHTMQKKTIHPYFQIHPWKSEIEFANSLLKNVIYNADGIVAINKPYGISVWNKFQQNVNHPLKQCHHIVGAVDYSVENVLPYLAKELDVPNLIPFSGSEKYMSGVYIFGINTNVCQDIKKAVRRVEGGKYRKFWAITTRIPNEIEGKYHLAICLKQNFSLKDKKVIILPQWSKNLVKKNIIKIFNVDYRVISNSTNNLSSLIEMEASTKVWHSLRLFASIMLYSPILGDNYHGSRVQEVMGTWVRIDPFAESCWDMPKINRQLLELLNVRQNQQEIIPVHIHLRNVRLISFGEKRKDIVLEAPLIHPFDWTCKQLKFKNVPYEENNEENKEKMVMKDLIYN